MSSPTAETETSSPSAIWGSMPITTNSVVPMPKAPMASASRARGKAELLEVGHGGGRGRRRPLQPRGAGPGSLHLTGENLVTSRAVALRYGPRRYGGSGLQQHLDRAVLLLPEGLVGL